MSNSMEKSEGTQNYPEKEVEMVKALRVRTVFTDEKILEKIADKIHEEGLVSGFSIQPAESGYFKDGKRVVEKQFELDFLLDPELSEEKRKHVTQLIENEIGKKWEIPAITQEVVEINKDLLGFVKRAEVEYQRYKKEKRVRLSLTLAVLLSISGIIAEASKLYVERREEKAVAAERMKELDTLGRIDAKISRQIADINFKLAFGKKGEGETIKSLERVPGEDFGMDSYKEINDLEKTVDEAWIELRKVIKSEGSREGKNK
jgi:uncharacterized protein involved in tolerance to divalent cations